MTPFYGFCRFVCLVLCRLIWRMRTTGTEHVPRSGPLIVACNHVSYLDPVALGVAMPRMLTYLAKKQLFRIPVLGPILRGLSVVPLDRDAGGVVALRVALRVLKDGRCVGIFPEGTRNLTGAAPEKGGAAFLAALSGAPVVPAAVTGTKDARSFARIQVVFGPPMTIVRNRKADADDLEKWTSEIMQRIHALQESIGGN